MGIILTVLQYRFLSCSYSVGRDVDIGGNWANMLGSEYRSSMWHGNVLVNRNNIIIQNTHIDMFNVITLFVIQSWNCESTWSANLQYVDLWPAEYKYLHYDEIWAKLVQSKMGSYFSLLLVVLEASDYKAYYNTITHS